MRKFLPALVIGILVLSGLGASAINTNSLKSALENNISEEIASASSPRDYTHTVLVEVGTATWCPSCPASNAAWHTLYEGGNFDFEYTELVDDMNNDAHARFYEFNPAWVPTSYFDGGMFAVPGTSQATFIADLNSAGARVVPDLVATLSAEWLGSAKIKITYGVQNNEATNYPGKLRIYVQELESRWNDYSGQPYHHSLIDMAKNIAIDIPAGGPISDSFTWDGAAIGFGDIVIDNIQVILAVFDETAHTGYSDPPTGNPFNAYYSDEAIAVIPFETPVNNPPATPGIQGPTTGKPNVEYSYTVSTTDPEGDNVYYLIQWGDGTGGTWEGPYASGTPVTFNHSWASKSTYVVKVKAKDTSDAESAFAQLQVTIPRAKINSLLQMLFEKFPNAFPVLRHLLGY